MYFGGFTLNTIALSGLAWRPASSWTTPSSCGENIFRHMEGGKKRAADAAVSGHPGDHERGRRVHVHDHGRLPPAVPHQGAVGPDLHQFALVVIFSIAVSLLDALTVVPMLASRFVKEKEVEEVHHPEHIKSKISFFRWSGLRLNAMDHAYRRLLEKAIRRRWWVLGGAIALSVVAFPWSRSSALRRFPRRTAATSR